MILLQVQQKFNFYCKKYRRTLSSDIRKSAVGSLDETPEVGALKL